MVIGWSQAETQSNDQASMSAWGQVEAVQRQLRSPCRLIPQPAHAVLAGEIATDLTCFGQLPPEIIRAIQMHDTGWAASDAHQIQRLRAPNAGDQLPVSFLAISPREAEEAWTASIDAVAAFSEMGAKVVSRHFTLLAQHDPVQHRHFLNGSKARQRKLAELQRWTSNTGRQPSASAIWCRCTWFAGSPGGGASARPSGLARGANRTAGENASSMGNAYSLHSRGSCAAGKTLSIQALKHPVPAHGPRTETMTWTVQ